MKRTRLIILAVLVGLLMPLPANAAGWKPWWDWLDELSGPGPFKGLLAEARLFCLGELVRRETDQGAIDDAVKAVLDKATALHGLSPSGRERIDLLKNDQRRSLDLPPRVERPVAPDLMRALSTLGTGGTFERRRLLASRVRQIAIDLPDLCPTCSNDQLRGLAQALTILANASDPVRPVQRVVGSGLGGFMFSACGPQDRGARSVAIDLGLRWMKARDQGPGERWAGGNEIRLVTLVPSISWRVFARRPRADFLTVGAGAGGYWMSSGTNSADQLPGGFRSFSGAIFEPFKLTVHVPEDLFKFKGHAALAMVKFRAGLALFPAGFDERAFGPNLTGEKARQIPAEWVPYGGFLIDADPLIRGLADLRRKP